MAVIGYHPDGCAASETAVACLSTETTRTPLWHPRGGGDLSAYSSGTLKTPSGSAPSTAPQAPFAQPSAHALSVEAYAQAPEWQTPLAAKVRSVFASLQAAGGGVLNETHAQGSAAQAPFAQPKAQG